MLGEGCVKGKNLVISRKESVKKWGEILIKEARLGSTKEKLRRLKGLKDVEVEEKEINLRDGWLSGFIEGDGGFNIEIRKDKRYKMGYRVRPRIYVEKKGEDRVMEKIARLIGGNIERRGEYNRVVVTSIEGSLRMRDYLKRNGLVSVKRIDMVR